MSWWKEVVDEFERDHKGEPDNTVWIQPVPPLTTINLPLIRKVLPSLIAADIVSVQPMTEPVGIFKMKVTYVDSSMERSDES